MERELACTHLHIPAQLCTDIHRYIHTYDRQTNRQTNARTYVCPRHFAQARWRVGPQAAGYVLCVVECVFIVCFFLFVFVRFFVCVFSRLPPPYLPPPPTFSPSSSISSSSHSSHKEEVQESRREKGTGERQCASQSLLFWDGLVGMREA